MSRSSPLWRMLFDPSPSLVRAKPPTPVDPSADKIKRAVPRWPRLGGGVGLEGWGLALAGSNLR